MTDKHAIHVVTFDFKGTSIRCVVCGSTDYMYQIHLLLVHKVVNVYNVYI